MCHFNRQIQWHTNVHKKNQNTIAGFTITQVAITILYYQTEILKLVRNIL